MSTRWTLLAGGLLLLGLVTWAGHWFLANHERYSKEIRAEVSPQARRNPYLAAERFLSRLGVASESVSGRERLLQLPAQPGLLLVNNLGPSLPPEREEALLDWVRGGGHLVVIPRKEWDEEQETSGNHLLDRLGVRLLVIALSEEDGNREEETSGATSGEGAVPVTLLIPGARQPVEVDFDRDRILVDGDGHADWVGSVEELGYMLQFQLGQGRLTVLSDDHYFTNGAIDQWDHALFLAQLAAGQERAWLLYSSKMPSLLSLLWRAAPQLLVCALVLLLLSLWRMGLRTGPLLGRGVAPRRSLLEHLDAVAGYAWRTDRGQQMSSVSQRALEQAWRRRHLILGGMDRKAGCEWIAQRTALTGAEVAAALYGSYAGEQEFIRMTGLQQRLAGQLRTERGKRT